MSATADVPPIDGPKRRARWTRLLYIVLFAIAYQIVQTAVMLIAIVQFVLDLFSGETLDTLRRFGAQLGLYSREIVDFLSYKTERMPFPFSDWPSADGTVVETKTNAPVFKN